MPYTIRRATAADWAAWLDSITFEDEDGVETPPSERDLFDRGVVVALEEAGEVVYHCGVLDPEKAASLPGEVLGEGRLRRRYRALPDALKPKIYRARVCRSPSRDLRAEAEAAAGESLGARRPGRRAGVTMGPAAVIAEARARVADEADDAFEDLVPMEDVEDSDVVVEDALPPFRWAGEVEV